MTVSAVMARSKRCVGRIASGMGKTFVVIALARYFRKLGEQIVIVLANDLLFDQFHLFVDLYLSDLDNITIKVINSLKTSDCVNKVVICDEFDDMIDKYPVTLSMNLFTNKVEQGGLLGTLKLKRLYMLSATVNNFYTTFSHKVLNVKHSDIILFLGARELF
jgi:hypothetical protein